ncbi:MAG: hypothetical protein WBL61_08235 [Bryobacteraceae bacterium]
MPAPFHLLLGVPALAAALVAVLTCAQIRLNGALGLTAAPRTDRWHRKPTPSSGGVAVFAACAAIYTAFFWGSHGAVAAGAAALWVLGLVDDRVRLRPLLKIGGQLAVIAFVIASGVVFPATAFPVFNVLLTAFWLVGITNAFNLIDNMDGLCAGTIVIICAFRCGLLATSGYFSDAALPSVIGAAFLGFLVFNYNPARIFMGDCGSMFAGFSLAALTIDSPLAHTKAFAAGVFCPALTFIYPVFDTILVTVLRRIAGRPISVGGRDHSSHRLVSLGFRERQVVWILWLLTALSCSVGLAAQWIPLEMIVASGVLAAALMVFAIFLSTLPEYPLPIQLHVGGAWIRRHIPTLRAGTIVIVDVLLSGQAFFLACLLGFHSYARPAQLHAAMVLLPIVMVSHGLACVLGRSFAISWRWLDLWDVAALARTALVGAACAFTAAWLLGVALCARDTMLLYLLLNVSLAALLRSGLRALHGLERNSEPRSLRVAVYGADAFGEMAASFLESHPAFNCLPVLFVDPRCERAGISIHGLPVHRLDDLDRVAAELHISAVFVGGRETPAPEHAELAERASSNGLQLLALDVSIRHVLAAELRTETV